MKEAIYVKYIYSSCIITKTPDISILHDPWFTEGIYDGSWYQFPKIKNPISSDLSVVTDLTRTIFSIVLVCLSSIKD